MKPMLEPLLKSNFEDPAEDRVYRPRQFCLSKREDRQALAELFLAPGIRVHDTLREQLQDLIRTRHPGQKLSAREVNPLVDEYISGSAVEEYGTWFYYPWSNRLVHVLDEPEFVELRTDRNRYKITPREQAALSCKRIGVVGLSVGQSVALTLAMERSFGELRLADFDRLDLSNLNRVRAGLHNLNLPKVYATAREIAEIDPYLHVTCFPDGVDEANCDAFLMGNSQLDVVVEECDSLDIKVLLRQRARRHRIPVVMETCDRGMVDIERFDLESDRVIFHGLIGETEQSSLHGLTTEQKIPYVLQIMGVHTLSSRLRASLLEVDQSISTWPQLASAVAHGGAAAADVVRRICLGHSVCSGRYYVDLEALIPSEQSGGKNEEHKISASAKPPTQSPEMLLPTNRGRKQKVGQNKLPVHIMRQLVADATTAPSGGNCQPWRWVSDHDELFLFHDLSRSYHPFDPDRLGGLVALGAATENLVLSAHAAGLEVIAEPFPSAEHPHLVARFSFPFGKDRAVEPSWRDELYSMVGTRRTNRKLCQRRHLEPGSLDAMTTAAQSINGANVCWLQNNDELDECATLLGISDRLVLLTESWNRFVVNEICWTPEEAAARRDGIALPSLELSPADQAGFYLCRDWQALKLVHSLRGGRNLEKMSHKALDSASAVGLITMPSKTRSAYFCGGRAMERLWLTATEHRLALHPMTSLPYMLEQFRTWRDHGLDSTTRHALQELDSRYRELFPVKGHNAQLFLFRLSYAEQTSHRSLRRNLDDVLTRR
jgi:molybdopterin/thiamine biosynthesis adenylyltransferase